MVIAGGQAKSGFESGLGASGVGFEECPCNQDVRVRGRAHVRRSAGEGEGSREICALKVVHSFDEKLLGGWERRVGNRLGRRRGERGRLRRVFWGAAGRGWW